MTGGAALFREYAAARRRIPPDGFRMEGLPHLVRYEPMVPGMEGFVAFADLLPGSEVECVREQVRHFADRGEAFEWKVYDLDRPRGLRAILEREGFEAGPAEAFMVRPLDGVPMPSMDASAGVRLARVLDADSVRDVVRVQEEVWRRDFSWMAESLWRTLSTRPDEVSVYCAYSGERPVGAGWTEFAPGSPFAEIHGGAVAAEARGRGIYSLLFRERLREAVARGCSHLTVDASPMSRPILERKGFVVVCHTYPMRWSPG